MLASWRRANRATRRRVIGATLAGLALVAGATAIVAGVGPTGRLGGGSAGDPSSAGSGPSTGAESLPQFASFQRWSDPNTWGGTVPTANTTVTIPTTKHIVVDTDVPRLKGLVIEGELAFADRPFTLHVGYIMVHGVFWLGTTQTPFRSPAAIVLDSGRDPEPKMGADGMGVNAFVAMGGGRIEIHGTPVGKTWTTLAQTAPVGSTAITLSQPVRWQPGDVIVLASADTDVDHKERATVAALSADGKRVTLAAKTRYIHVSAVTSESAGGSTRSVAERDEVGLLRHNVKITGPDTATTTHIGGHIMIESGGILRMSDAELVHMGQMGKLGRYPIHWHYAGNAASSLVQNVAVHDSFNRMVTIHQTRNVHVQGVVGDETYGHAFFLEDGVETGNVLTENLVMGVRKVPSGKRLRKSDEIPSEFWISNPQNTLTGNAAAGGEGAGFWYDFNYNSDNKNIDRAIGQPFGPNTGSVAHSHQNTQVSFANNAAGDGIAIEGFEGDSRTVGKLVDATVWKNEGFGFWSDGALVTVNPMAANNGIAMNCQDTVVQGGLLIGNGTANTRNGGGFISGLIRFYHGQCDVGGTWLANFKRSGASSPDLAAIVDSGASSANYTNRIRGVRFFGGGYRVGFANSPGEREIDHSHWFADLDGSVVGNGKPVYITNNAALLRTQHDRVMYPAVGTSYLAGDDFGIISPLDHGVVRLELGGQSTITRSDGTTGDGQLPALNMGARYAISGQFSSIDGLHIFGSDPGYVDLVFDWTGRSAPEVSYMNYGHKVTVKPASSVASIGSGGQYAVSGGKLYLRIVIQGSPVPFGSGNLDSVSNRDTYWNVN